MKSVGPKGPFRSNCFDLGDYVTFVRYPGPRFTWPDTSKFNLIYCKLN